MRENIIWLLDQITDERTLAKIYAFINHLVCKRG